MQNNNALNLEKNFFFQNSTNDNLKKRDIHYHSNYEIYYLLNGKCWYFIDKKSYHLSNGDIALIPKGVIHKTNYETSNHSRILINCSEDYIPESVINLIPQIPYFTIPTATRPLINDIFETIQKEYYSPNRFSMDIIKSKVYELLLYIACENSLKEKEKTESLIVEKAVKYIQKHYADNLSLSDVAKYCFVSDEHLSRKFKKETGFGFNEFVNIYRLRKADLWLRNDPKAKISEIATNCGFNDSNYFSKVYKKVYKISPKEAKKGKSSFSPTI